MSQPKLEIVAGREMFVSRLGDTADDIDLVLCTARYLLASFPDPNPADADDPRFDIERIKLVDFIQSGRELSALLRKLRSAALTERNR